RTTLSPTLLLRDGIPVETLGTPGGDQQDQWQLVYLLRRLVGGYYPQQAIDAPMFHTASHVASFEPRTWSPGELVIERRVGRTVLTELRARGHRVTVDGDWTLGRLSMVGRDPATGVLFAAANPRMAQGYAAGR
ncbi:MAG: gamma-glutamyltransferase, partial [Leifsonia sp.]